MGHFFDKSKVALEFFQHRGSKLKFINLERNYYFFFDFQLVTLPITDILANTDRKCKFWERNWLCKAAVGGCGVEACREDEIPTGIKGSVENTSLLSSCPIILGNDYGVYDLLSIPYSKMLSRKC